MAEIVTGEEAEAIKSSAPSQRQSFAQAMREGAVVFTPGLTKSSPVNTLEARTIGKRLRSRQAERDGVVGRYWWLEDK